MKKSNLTLAETVKAIAELEKNGVVVVKPLPNLPEGLYSGTFATQKKGNKNEAVCNVIDYERDGEKRAFPQVMVNVTNDETGEKYQNVGIALTDEVQKQIKVSANLTKKYAFRAEKGRVRTFLSLAS